MAAKELDSTWLWNIARGISGDEVEGRLLPKSHGCGKTFPGPQALKTIASVEHWLNELCDELSERLQSDMEKNKRVAHTLTLHARAYKHHMNLASMGNLMNAEGDNQSSNDSETQKKFPSRSCPLRYGTEKIQEDALKLFESALREFLGACRVQNQRTESSSWGVTSLSISASKIVATPSGTSSILRFFHGCDPCSPAKLTYDGSVQDLALQLPSGSASCLDVNQAEEQKTYDQLGNEISSGPSQVKQERQNLHEESFNATTAAAGQDAQEGRQWGYKVEEIDPAIIDELPLQIQAEVRSWVRTNKRAKTAKKGCSIAQYFLPVRKD
ncbi:hypothetical protein ACLOJK_041523 [Asimina triloba]